MHRSGQKAPVVIQKANETKLAALLDVPTGFELHPLSSAWGAVHGSWNTEGERKTLVKFSPPRKKFIQEIPHTSFKHINGFSARISSEDLMHCGCRMGFSSKWAKCYFFGAVSH